MMLPGGDSASPDRQRLELATLTACKERGDEPPTPGPNTALYVVSANTHTVSNLLGAWVASRHCRLNLRRQVMSPGMMATTP